VGNPGRFGGIINKQETSKNAFSGKKSRIFLASPYTHEDKEVMAFRYEAALETTARLIREGNIVFSPIVHSHPIAIAYDLPKDYKFWQAYTNSFILHWAEHFSILCLNDWQNSVGLLDEFNLAMKVRLSFSFIHMEK
jgi:hypothetical protein